MIVVSAAAAEVKLPKSHTEQLQLGQKGSADSEVAHSAHSIGVTNNCAPQQADNNLLDELLAGLMGEHT